jgi:hypothetical protein
MGCLQGYLDAHCAVLDLQERIAELERMAA